MFQNLWSPNQPTISFLGAMGWPEQCKRDRAWKRAESHRRKQPYPPLQKRSGKESCNKPGVFSLQRFPDPTTNQFSKPNHCVIVHKAEPHRNPGSPSQEHPAEVTLSFNMMQGRDFVLLLFVLRDKHTLSWAVSF